MILVLGAPGGIGGETAHVLCRHGWKVRTLSRNGELAGSIAPFAWHRGDAMDREAVVVAARGTDAIVHAVNPPGYRNWAGLVVPMIENKFAMNTV